MFLALTGCCVVHIYILLKGEYCFLNITTTVPWFWFTVNGSFKLRVESERKCVALPISPTLISEYIRGKKVK